MNFFSSSFFGCSWVFREQAIAYTHEAEPLLMKANAVPMSAGCVEVGGADDEHGGGVAAFITAAKKRFFEREPTVRKLA